jgi:hypothetical protein
MGGAVLYGPRDVRFEERDAQTIMLLLDQVAEDYRAMDERRAIKTLPRP